LNWKNCLNFRIIDNYRFFSDNTAMAKTETRRGMLTWKETSSQVGAFAFNVLNLAAPAPITFWTALTMTLTTGAFTGLEIADLTTKERSQKKAAVMEGLGAMVINRGAAMATVGSVFSDEKLLIPGLLAFGAGLTLMIAGEKLSQDGYLFRSNKANKGV